MWLSFLVSASENTKSTRGSRGNRLTNIMDVWTPSCTVPHLSTLFFLSKVSPAAPMKTNQQVYITIWLIHSQDSYLKINLICYCS